jgi:hypothetical protein
MLQPQSIWAEKDFGPGFLISNNQPGLSLVLPGAHVLHAEAFKETYGLAHKQGLLPPIYIQTRTNKNGYPCTMVYCQDESHSEEFLAGWNQPGSRGESPYCTYFPEGCRPAKLKDPHINILYAAQQGFRTSYHMLASLGQSTHDTSMFHPSNTSALDSAHTYMETTHLADSHTYNEIHPPGFLIENTQTTTHHFSLEKN